MNKDTLEALRGSIKKWESIVKSTDAEDLSGGNCPLCRKFSSSECIGCPVEVDTGAEDCAYTPYSEWIDHFDLVHDIVGVRHRFSDCKECLRLAQKELDYLIALLPPLCATLILTDLI